MEEAQIKEFVHRAHTEEGLRAELARDFDGVMAKEGFSPRVARVLQQITHQMFVHNDGQNRPTFQWWGP